MFVGAYVRDCLWKMSYKLMNKYRMTMVSINQVEQMLGLVWMVTLVLIHYSVSEPSLQANGYPDATSYDLRWQVFAVIMLAVSF